MSGSQMKQRVFTPLIAIAATVLALGLLGQQLLRLSGATDSMGVAAPLAPAATEAQPSQSASALPVETVAPPARFPVSVFNASTKVGYAKQIGDSIKTESWVVQEVGNWEGAAVSQNTVFYPAGQEAAAAELAKSKYVNGVVAPATVAYDQTALTLVLAK
jgi:hypothetical protein